jgi:hypothetical protein
MNYTMRLDGSRLESLDDLYLLREIVKRNGPPDCDVTACTAMIVRDAAGKRNCHVWQADFADGTKVAFILRLPQFVSEATVLKNMAVQSA